MRFKIRFLTCGLIVRAMGITGARVWGCLFVWPVGLEIHLNCPLGLSLAIPNIRMGILRLNHV